MRAGRRRRARSSPCRWRAADGSRPRASWAVPDWEARAAALPPAPPRVRLLSPFDPILRDRKRTLRLFDFDFRFEAFVPEAQRRFTATTCCRSWRASAWSGRLDPKLHRERGMLEVKNLWWEPGVRESKGRRASLEAALDRLARLVGAERGRWLDPYRPARSSARCISRSWLERGSSPGAGWRWT